MNLDHNITPTVSFVSFFQKIVNDKFFYVLKRSCMFMITSAPCWSIISVPNHVGHMSQMLAKRLVGLLSS
jgi:hypothetical protein